MGRASMSETSLSELLEKLGLTEYEGKTLSALFKLGEAEAPDVSRIAQVPKTRVYDVLDRLVDKKLVIEIRGRPKKYRVVDATQALDLLVSEQKRNLSRLEEQAMALKLKLAAPAKTGGGDMVLKVKSPAEFDRILAQEIAGAKNEIVGLSRLSGDSTLVTEALKTAHAKKVNVRLLNHPGHRELHKHFSAKSVRYADHGLNAFVIDNQKAILGLSDHMNPSGGDHYFAIWPNRPAMVSTLKHYFDKCWTNSKNG